MRVGLSLFSSAIAAISLLAACSDSASLGNNDNVGVGGSGNDAAAAEAGTGGGGGSAVGNGGGGSSVGGGAGSSSAGAGGSSVAGAGGAGGGAGSSSAGTGGGGNPTGGAAGTAGVGGSGGGLAGAAGCDAILIKNTGLPVGYPPTYTSATDAQLEFEQRAQEFRAAYGVGSEVTLTPHDVTYTPYVKDTTHSIPVSEAIPPQIDDTAVDQLARAFLAQWGALFAVTDVQLDTYSTSTSASDKKTIRLTENYCGLGVASAVTEYQGSVTVVMNGTGRLEWVADNVVPLIPVYVNPSQSPAEIQSSLFGLQFTFYCNDGAHFAQVDANATFEFAQKLFVFVSKVGDQATLAYRTAYEVNVTPKPGPNEPSGLTWKLHVDAFGGGLLREEALFICD